MSEDQFSKNDCISNIFKVYVELKSRNTHYDDLLIEKIKYDAILEQAIALKYKPYYINATPQGIWAFNLSKIKDIKWEDRWLPQNTEFSARGNKTKVVGYLSIKDGKEL